MAIICKDCYNRDQIKEEIKRIETVVEKLISSLKGVYIRLKLTYHACFFWIS